MTTFFNQNTKKTKKKEKRQIIVRSKNSILDVCFTLLPEYEGILCRKDNSPFEPTSASSHFSNVTIGVEALHEQAISYYLKQA